MPKRHDLWAWLKSFLKFLPYIALVAPPLLGDSSYTHAKWVIIALAIVTQAWKDRTGATSAEQKMAQRLRGHLSTLVDEIEAVLGPEFKGILRANIMRPCDPYSLRIFCCVGGYKPKEMTMPWEIGKGVCGLAHSRGRMIYGDLQPQSSAKSYEDILDATGQTPYGLSEDHWALTRNLKTVLAIPIYEANDARRRWGVLCIDSTAPMPAEKVDSEIAKTLDTYRKTIGISILS